MIVDVCMIILTSIFFIIAIILLVLVGKLIKTLKNVDQTLIEATKLQSDLRFKLTSLDPLFNSIENLGVAAEIKTSCLKENLRKSKEEEGAIDVADVAALANLGFRLWNKFNKRRQYDS